MELIIRDIQKDEQNFILSSWIKNYLLGIEAELMGRTEAAKYLQEQILNLFSQNKIKVKCIGDGETDEIYSYVIFNNTNVFFIYTKNIYRKSGLAKRLINECNLAGKEFNLIINPFMTKILVDKYKFKYKATFRI